MMRKLLLVFGVALCLGIATTMAPAYAQQIDRTQLPIPDTQYKYPGKVPLDARDTKFPPINQAISDQTSPAARGCAQCSRNSARRYRLRRAEHFWRRRQYAGTRFTREAGSALHAVSYGGALLADARGAPYRTQPSFGGDGRDY